MWGCFATLGTFLLKLCLFRRMKDKKILLRDIILKQNVI